MLEKCKSVLNLSVFAVKNIKQFRKICSIGKILLDKLTSSVQLALHFHLFHLFVSSFPSLL